MASININNDSVWELPPRINKVISLQISRNTLVALLFSILVHLMLLWIFAPRLFSMGVPIKDSPPLEITLGPPQKKEVAKSEPMPLPQEVVPEAIPEPAKPKPKRIIKEKSKLPKQVEPVKTAKRSDLTVPTPPEKTKEPAPSISSDPLPGEDMQAYIKRQKEAKLAAEGYSKQDAEEVLASSNEPSAGERRDAKIKENLNLNGTNGIFEVRELGLHSAQFSFKGWKNNINSARLEIFDVHVPDGMDAKRAVIKKMIEIIRREYNGDFNWDSRRLGRVIVLSARLEDNEALEDFLMNEFFAHYSR